MGSQRRLTAVDGYLRTVRSFAHDRDPAKVVRSLAAALLHERGIDVPDSIGDAATGDLAGGDQPPLPGDDLRTPWLLGHVHEALMEARARRRAGAHYTPPEVARRLVAFAREGHEVAAGVEAPFVCDPAVGGGVFLLAAAESLAADGVDPGDVVAHHLHGSDIDPLAVDVARCALALWAGAWPNGLDEHIVVADALRSDRNGGCFDLVVGNPPFQNQLASSTARGQAGTEELRARFGASAHGYVDNAALFLLAGLDLVKPGGRVALVQPHSTLATRDAQGVRSELLERGDLVGVWFATERVFSAGVYVWAPVIERREEPQQPRVSRRVGVDFEAAPSVDVHVIGADSNWAELVSDLTGVPAVAVRAEGRVGDLATATAGFRDQFYGLVGAVHEHDGAGDVEGERAELTARLVTSGLVEPLAISWGRVPVRFAGERWQRPVVALDRVEPAIDRWVRAQLVPKLVVATQTKVIEVAVDVRGDMVPSVPVIAVHADPDRLWHLAAALSAPPLSALALRSSVGTALSTDAIKLSARQVLDLPLPHDRVAWDEAAALARQAAEVAAIAEAGRTDDRRAALEAYGVAACRAYGVDPEALMSWWLDRLPAESRVVPKAPG